VGRPEVENNGNAAEGCPRCCCHPCRCEESHHGFPGHEEVLEGGGRSRDPETWGSEEAYEEWLFDEVFDDEEE
jgi:hypothetical protein